MDSLQKGIEFEKSVAELFAKLGYKKILQGGIINGSRIDIIAECELPDGSTIKNIIECKNYLGKVRIEEVNKFNLIFQNLRNAGKIHTGVIVSRNGFTTQAEQAASFYGLKVYDYARLLAETKGEHLSQEEIELVKEEKPNKQYAFVLMPFEKEFNDVYYFGVRSAVEKANLYCERVDEIHYTGGIIEKVKEQIKKADIIIAEMTGRNANVFYEVGLAHAWDKKTILIVKDANEIPFDLKGQNHIVYNGSIRDLELVLTERLKAVCGGMRKNGTKSN